MFSDETLIYLAVWTICAVVAWWIAMVKKAPDAGTWALAGLLLGPFGILAAIAFAKPPKVTPPAP